MKKIGCFVIALLPLLCAHTFAGAPSGQVTFTFTPTVAEKTKEVILWVPYPMSDEFQTIDDMRVSGNFTESGVYRDPGSEAVYLYAHWTAPNEKPRCVIGFHIRQKDRRRTKLDDSHQAYPELVARYLAATEQIPADDPEMKAIALKAVDGKKGTYEKALAIYDWVVENT
ncbi:MAG: transglutaminase, partial [Desulfatitalea sp.]|nr:hypothetical protein [Desulfatitalea sp.]NNJ99382.1 transglutaminase [Desulfatitalea sp.]